MIEIDVPCPECQINTVTILVPERLPPEVEYEILGEPGSEPDSGPHSISAQQIHQYATEVAPEMRQNMDGSGDTCFTVDIGVCDECGSDGGMRNAAQ